MRRRLEWQEAREDGQQDDEATHPTQIQKKTPSFLFARNSVSTSRTAVGDPPEQGSML